MTQFRHYDPEKDKEATHRIWHEVGWLEKDKDKEAAMDTFVACGRALVAEVAGEAECLVLSVPATLRYLEDDLPFLAVTGVTVSRVARKQGLGGHLTAQLIAEGVADGAMAAGLSMFEQGFYDQLGLGTGGYEHWVSFDPAQLQLTSRHRVPRRITLADAEKVHASRLSRLRRHGAANLLPPAVTQADMTWTKGGFGLGYFDGPNGELTHHFWVNDNEEEQGPYDIVWMAYQTPEQFLELLALIKSLGDQVRLVWMREPAGIQLQDFLIQPFRYRALTDKSKYENRIKADAYWQLRICDLPGCLAKTHLCVEDLRFNLELTDPIERFLDASMPWRGVGGTYVVTLGANSCAEQGRDPLLPTLHASVNAFSRLWFGVRPATGLAITDQLSGPAELLQALDRVLRLPDPKYDWDF